jgi:DNA-binding transcriptional LysR family regulator
MDAHLLQAFVNVIDQGSFSEAAERLHITQPAISKRLAALENQTGNRLIDRSNRIMPNWQCGTGRIRWLAGWQ